MGPSATIDPGENAPKAAPTHTESTVPHANQRQPLVGSRPSGNNSARNIRRPKLGTQSQEKIQAAASPNGSDPGAARKLRMAYSATKKPAPHKSPVTQNNHPTRFRGSLREIMTAPTIEELITNSVSSSQ